MLPYEYLAFLLKNKSCYETKELITLWDFNTLFPSTLIDKKTNKKDYWKIINKQITKITGISNKDFNNFLMNSQTLIDNYVKFNINYLNSYIKTIENEEKIELSKWNSEKKDNMLLYYMIDKKTSSMNQSLKNIKKFRIKNGEN